ncbi:hypothetical protein Tco_0537832 [Tanacetum coccineum]
MSRCPLLKQASFLSEFYTWTYDTSLIWDKFVSIGIRANPTFRGSNTRSGGLWSGGLDSKRGVNRDQHSRDQRAWSDGLWSGGLDPKRGANRDQHSRDQRERLFFKGWGIVMIPHRPSMGLVDGL